MIFFLRNNFKSESYLIGKGLQPVQAYLNIPEIIKIAKVFYCLYEIMFSKKCFNDLIKFRVKIGKWS